eukprot:TRINITY_DN9618_c0_g2_i1.p1 TRINITY_DN9618_c0_g2~~TRINITY_DN9618_c0_g2_i1.p1  ORF type:complete len:769 (+),score=112.34 TRINITY_DN9618_c0_g2_i1:69-2375(+)
MLRLRAVVRGGCPPEWVSTSTSSSSAAPRSGKQQALDILLLEAVKNGTAREVDELVSRGADVQQVKVRGQNLLFEAAGRKISPYGGRVSILKSLVLTHGVNAAYVDMHMGQTPLFFAAREGDHEACEFLLEQKCHPDSSDTAFSQTALFYAARGGHQAIAELLLERRATLDRGDIHEETPLFYAASGGQASMMAMLLERRADLQKTNRSRRTCLFEARGDAVSFALSARCEPNHQDRDHRTPIFIAASTGDVDKARLLVRSGADVNSQDIYGRTCLFLAATKGHVAMLESLCLELHADALHKDLMGHTAMVRAKSHKKGRAAQILGMAEKKRNLELRKKSQSMAQSSTQAARSSEEQPSCPNIAVPVTMNRRNMSWHVWNEGDGRVSKKRRVRSSRAAFIREFAVHSNADAPANSDADDVPASSLANANSNSDAGSLSNTHIGIRDNVPKAVDQKCRPSSRIASVGQVNLPTPQNLQTCPAPVVQVGPQSIEHGWRRSPRIVAQKVDKSIVLTRTPADSGADVGFQKFGPKRIEPCIRDATDVRLLEGKGRCLFSRGDHQPKDLIGMEMPLFKCAPRRSDSVLKGLKESLSAIDIEVELVYAAVHIMQFEPQLQSRLRMRFAPEPNPSIRNAMDIVLRLLAGQGEQTTANELGKLYNALSFNAFTTSTCHKHFVSFDVLAQVAHSCQPNCEVVVHSNGYGRLEALTHVAAGEELRISYLGEDLLQLGRSARRQRLLDKWGFHCNCQRCASGPPASSHFALAFLPIASH